MAPKKQPKPEALTEAMHWALHWLSIFPSLDREGWRFPTGEAHPTRQTLESLRSRGFVERGTLKVTSLGTRTENFVWRLSKRGEAKLNEAGRPALADRGEVIEAAILALTGAEAPDAKSA